MSKVWKSRFVVVIGYLLGIGLASLLGFSLLSLEFWGYLGLALFVHEMFN